MRRMKISTYRKAAFIEGEAPDVQALRRGIERHTIPGERVGGLYYVFVNDDLTLAHEYLKAPELEPVNDSAAKLLKSMGLI